MKKPHKHAEIIKAWADGAEIQWYDSHPRQHRWFDCGPNQPSWSESVQFRIKPEPKPDYIFKTCLHWNSETNCAHTVVFGDNNIQLTFDGETGKLKSAGVI